MEKVYKIRHKASQLFYLENLQPWRWKFGEFSNLVKDGGAVLTEKPDLKVWIHEYTLVSEEIKKQFKSRVIEDCLVTRTSPKDFEVVQYNLVEECVL